MKNINLAEKNGMWKEVGVGMTALHEWIKSRKPKPNLCECCGVSKAYDLANISNTYKRDVKDFGWLCRKCHMRKDGRIKNLKRSQLFGKDNPNWKGGVSNGRRN